MPGQGVSLSKMTPGTWGEQIQGGGRGGYSGECPGGSVIRWGRATFHTRCQCHEVSHSRSSPLPKTKLSPNYPLISNSTLFAPNKIKQKKRVFLEQSRMASFFLLSQATSTDGKRRLCGGGGSGGKEAPSGSPHPDGQWLGCANPSDFGGAWRGRRGWGSCSPLRGCS